MKRDEGQEAARPLTRAQVALLRKLADEPGSALALVMVDDGGYNEQPRFRGWFHHAPCRTCHHTEKDRADWRAVHELSERGHIAERLRGTGWYAEVTAAGRAALASAGALR